jgi:hydroxymethylglutaryl-CoA lyase
MLHGMGIDTGIDLDGLVDTGRWLAALLGRNSGSKVTQAMGADDGSGQGHAVA